jgi:hypothetical protein
MEIRFRLSSFRTRIILTLILVITSVSLISFYAYNTYLSQKIYRNTDKDLRSVLHVLRDEIIAVHDGRMIQPILKTLEPACDTFLPA